MDVGPQLLSLVVACPPARSDDLPGAEEAIGVADEDGKQLPLLACEGDSPAAKRQGAPASIQQHAADLLPQGRRQDGGARSPQRGSHGGDQGAGGEGLGQPVVSARLQVELCDLNASIKQKKQCLSPEADLGDYFQAIRGTFGGDSPDHQVETAALKGSQGELGTADLLHLASREPEAGPRHRLVCLIRLDQQCSPTIAAHGIRSPVRWPLPKGAQRPPNEQLT